MPRLNKRFLNSEQKKDILKDSVHWDDDLKGFGLRAQPGGALSWVIMYRTLEGRRLRKHTLGSARKMTADQARIEARRKLASVDQGADPSEEKRSANKAMSISELCDLYIKDAETRAGEDGEIKHSTLKMDKSRIKCHLKPLIGALSVRSLTTEDIEKLQSSIAAGKTAKPRKDKGRSGLLTGGRGVAARTVGMLGTILEFAKRQKIIKDNPARSVKRFEDGKNRRFLSQDEIKSLGKAMRNSEAENGTGIAAIRALLLTGCRKNEILGLPWAWLDTKAKCIRFEDTKSGAQIRPIGAVAAEHLKSQTKGKDSKGDVSPWIFPADYGDGHFIGLPRVLERLCDKAKIKGVTLHILRHTFAATAAELGFSELTIAGLLGHTVSGVTARYAHIPDSALIIAADRVSAHIATALGGTLEMADIIPMYAAKDSRK